MEFWVMLLMFSNKNKLTVLATLAAYSAHCKLISVIKGASGVCLSQLDMFCTLKITFSGEKEAYSITDCWTIKNESKVSGKNMKTTTSIKLIIALKTGALINWSIFLYIGWSKMAMTAAQKIEKKMAWSNTQKREIKLSAGWKTMPSAFFQRLIGFWWT